MLTDRIPLKTKRRLKRAWWLTRQPTTRWRALPDFIVLGAQKAGTTSLFRYLCAQPEVARPFGQEPVFFSHEIKYTQGVQEYLVNFPLRASLRVGPSGRSTRITGEASGEYLYYPAAPQRIANLVPGVRLIAVLRNPIDRSISQYFHNVKLGLEDLDLEAALQREERWQCDEGPEIGRAHRQFGPLGSHRAYMGRSMYAQHLERWFEHFDPSQLLVLEAESLYEDPASVTATVCAFLGLRSPADQQFGQHNVGRRADVDDSITKWMEGRFRAPNSDLRLLLDTHLGDRAPHLRWCG